MAGTLLALQIDRAVDNTWVAIAAGVTFKKTGATPLQISYTPEVPCWWDVTAYIGGLQKDDAAYHYSYGSLVLTPADADGQDTRNVIATQHNTVTPHKHRVVRAVFKLNAGTLYTVQYWHQPNGGTWQFYQASLTAYITGKVWAQ